MAALPFVAMAMMAVGTLMSAASQAQQARDAKKAADFNASIAERNAGIARQQAAQDAMLQQRQARQQFGAATAAYGASGVTLEGSPLDVLEASAASAELDRQTILYKGELRAMGYTDDATISRVQGQSAYNYGMGQAASTLLKGAGQTYSMGRGMNVFGASKPGAPIETSGGFG